jgi:PAS domain S-box-containing protein
MTLAGRVSALLVTLLAFAAGADHGRAADVMRHVRFQHITTDDGLSRSFVQAILKDSQGFLWFGTADGLNRYDGRSFTVYRHDPKDPESLPSSQAGVLYEDSKKRLWVGSSWSAEGLALYDRARDRFKRFRPTAGHRGSEVRAIIEDRQGQLWVGTDQGVAQFDPEAGTFKVFSFPSADAKAPIAASVMSLLEDRRGVLWVGTGAGLLTFDRASGRYTRWNAGGEDPVGLNHGEISDLLEDEQGTLWVPTLGGGLFRIDPATGREMHYRCDPSNPQSLGHPRVRSLASDGQGHIYVGTENGGLDVLDRASGRFTHFRADVDEEESLNSDSIWALRMDDQGILWIGTAKGGVNVLSPFFQRFELLRARRGGLTDPHVSAVLEDSRGDLWIGTDGGGIDRLDRRSGRFTHYRHDPKNPATIGSDSIFAMFEDPQGKLWVGGWDAGLARLDPASGRIVCYRHDERDPSSIVSNHVWSVTAFHTGALLVSTISGVDVFDPSTGRFSRLSARAPGAGGGFTSFAVEDRKGDLWITTTVSVQHVEHSTGKVRIYTSDSEDSTSLPPGATHLAYVDSLGNVWIGTEGGLWLIAKGGERRRRYTTADGLPNDNVGNILEDGSGNLWLSTSRGLVCMLDAVRLAEKPKFLYFDVRDGLQGQEFSERAAFRSRSGEMFFGGQRGLSIFRPDAIRPNPLPPRVVFTDLRILNRTMRPGVTGSPLLRPMPETEAIRLSYRHSMVTIEFAALNFLLPQKNQYAYRLEGIDPGWNEVGTQRTATYTRLPAGDYTLRVRASNNDGVWNETGASLRIRVTPPFWASLWAYAAYVLLAVGSVAGVVRWRVRATEARRRELEATVRERTTDLEHEVAEHKLTETKLVAENEHRRRAEEEARQYVEKLAESNVELTDGQRALQQKQADLERENEERRRAEEAASRERDLLHALMDNIPDLIYFKDAHSRFVRVNAAHAGALGLAHPDDAVGHSDRDYFPAEFARAALKEEQELLQSGKPLLGKLEHEDRSGRWYLATKVPLRGANGTITGLVGISRDITARRQAEERLASDLTTFQQTVDVVAKGDLTRKGQEGADTVGQIARSVNGMIAGFSAILVEVRDAALSVSSSSSEILAAATEISKGAEFGSDRVHSTSSSVEEMAAAVTQVSRNAIASAERARQVLEHVQQGDRAVDATYLGMTRIDAAVLQTAEKMRLLEQRSQEIFEIIGLIEEIASQSKLLSLNAAIEAAHAGAAGRGFGVVADEVRRLAESSTEATKNVSERVDAMRQEMETVRQATENAMREVRDGRVLSEQARQSLREISTLVQDSVNLASQISGASGEQVEATKTVAEAMQTIADVTAQSAIGAKETTKAVQDLVRLSERLTHAISRFQIDHVALS